VVDAVSDHRDDVVVDSRSSSSESSSKLSDVYNDDSDDDGEFSFADFFFGVTPFDCPFRKVVADDFSLTENLRPKHVISE